MADTPAGSALPPWVMAFLLASLLMMTPATTSMMATTATTEATMILLGPVLLALRAASILACRALAAFSSGRWAMVRASPAVVGPAVVGLAVLGRAVLGGAGGSGPEEGSVETGQGSRAPDQPGTTEGQADVASDLLGVLRLRRGHLPAAAEAAAVDGEAASPGLADADDEGEHEDPADRRRDPGEQTHDEQCAHDDLHVGQGVSDVGGDLVGHHPVGLHRARGPLGVAHLEGAGDDEDATENQPGEQSDDVQERRMPAARVGCDVQVVVDHHAVVALCGHLRFLTPSASSRVRVLNAANPSSGSRSVRQATRADPTMTPSAKEATSAACWPLETPRPTHTGRSVTALVRSTSSLAPPPTAVRAPVTPIVEAAYTKPRQLLVTHASRSSVELGATRKTRSRPVRSLAAIQSPASSGTRSGVIRPAPPAAANRSAKVSTPIRRTRFQ